VIYLKPIPPIDVTLDEIGKRIALQIKGLCRKYPVEQRRKTSLLFYFNLHDTFFDSAEQVGRILLQSELAISTWAAVEATCLPHQFNLRNTLRKMLAVSVARRTYGIG